MPSSNKRSRKSTKTRKQVQPYVADDTNYNEQYGRVISSCQDCFPLHANAKTLCAPECIYPSSKVADFLEKVYQNKVPTRKIFIVGYGPPASGKSGIVHTLQHDKAFTDLHVTEENTVSMNVDAVFQNKESPLYYGTQLHKLHASRVLKDNPNKRDQRLYSTYRHIADQLNDLLFWKSLALGYNIYFETTGWSVEWVNTFIHYAHRAGYSCVVCYPFVTTVELLKRIHARKEQVGRDDKYVHESVKRAQTNIAKLELNTESGDSLVVLDNRASNVKQQNKIHRAHTMPVLYRGKHRAFSIKKHLNHSHTR